MDASQLKAAFLKLLKEDEEFRYTVAGYLGVAEVLKRLDKLAEEQTKIWKEIRRTWREIRRIWREIREIKKEQAKMWETINSVKSEVATGFDRLQRHLDALGARWGVMSEKAFREGLRGVVERELGLRVERWTAYDEEGKVFGFPSEVEVDVARQSARRGHLQEEGRALRRERGQETRQTGHHYPLRRRRREEGRREVGSRDLHGGVGAAAALRI